MDDSFCFRTLYTICINMGHNIMANFLLAGFCHIIINIFCMGFQFIDLLLCDRKSQLLLGLCQCDPQLSPGAEFHVLRKNVLHLLAGITL